MDNSKNYEAKAIELRSQATKKVAKKSFLEALFGGSSDRIEKAIEYYQKAGNMFKLAKNWLEAGTAYVDAADLYISINEHHNAANLFVNAAQCWKRIDQKKAVECFLKAIEIYTEMGRFPVAARYYQMIAEMMEENEDSRQAVKYYEQAADYYQSENHVINSNKCLTKVAEHAAISEEYSKAIEIFQRIAEFNLTTTMLKYSAKDYFFRAALCHLCADDGCNNVGNILNDYAKMCPDFNDSREYEFIIHLGKCLETCDEESFTKNTEMYDCFTRLHPWQVTMLLRIKRKICQPPDLR